MLQDIPLHQNVKVKVIPRAKKTEIVGTMSDGIIKIRVRAVPEDGRANKELLDFLNAYTGGEWELVSGQTHTRKVVRRRV